MTIEDIIKEEIENNNTVILFREGIFWKAYEKSAYAFCKHVKPFMVKKKYIRTVNDEIVSIGFPMSSTKAILQGRTILQEEERKMVVSIDQIDHESFMEWKKEQTLTAPPANSFSGASYSNNSEAFSCSNQEKEIINRIRLFNLENKTPLECMFFLSEIKKQLLS
ncbi:MAG: hypothetical protein LBF17_06230 [Mediterranea sp.]|jgi:hypothetical protein|nr:hypothetical protein [Mediterranea sp.]